MTGTIMPFHVDWGAVAALDGCGPLSTALAKRILIQHRQAGAMGVRACSAPATWLRPLFRKHGVPIVVGLVWNSIFTTDPNRAQAQWLKSAYRMSTVWRPDLVYIDREGRGIKENQNTVAQARQIVHGTVGPHVPIFVYCGDHHFPKADSGDAPCPHFYDVWTPERHLETVGMTPVERLYWIRRNYHHPAWFDVQGGYPWLCPYKGIPYIPSNLVSMEDWVSVVTELHHLKVAGISMCPSPYGYARTLGGNLYAEIHGTLLQYMHAAHVILRVAA